MPARLELTGQKFGRLTVLHFVRVSIYRESSKNTVWLCRCTCGNEVEVRGVDLKHKRTMSCGCLNRELAKERANLRWHGTGVA